MFRLEAALGLQAALRLAGGHADGLMLLPTQPEAVWRSFAAALICWPAFIALRLMVYAETGSDLGIGLIIVIETCAYAVSWFGFALASRHLAGLLGVQLRWPRFLAAWNWTNVLQYLLAMAGELPNWLGLPRAVLIATTVVAGLAAIFVEWQSVRLALGLRGPLAALVVVLDIAVSLLARGVADAVLASAASS